MLFFIFTMCSRNPTCCFSTSRRVLEIRRIVFQLHDVFYKSDVLFFNFTMCFNNPTCCFSISRCVLIIRHVVFRLHDVFYKSDVLFFVFMMCFRNPTCCFSYSSSVLIIRRVVFDCFYNPMCWIIWTEDVSVLLYVRSSRCRIFIQSDYLLSLYKNISTIQIDFFGLYLFLILFVSKHKCNDEKVKNKYVSIFIMFCFCYSMYVSSEWEGNINNRTSGRGWKR